MINLGDSFPDFEAETSVGKIKFHEWLGDSWGILFSHPHDFTPVCTTELARVAKLMPEFHRLGVKVIAMSCNSVKSHKEWIEDIKAYGGIKSSEFPYPIIDDESRRLVSMLGMMDLQELDSAGIPVSARGVFIIDSNKKMRLSILYPATTGRNFDEIIRVIESLHMTDKYKVATPVDWKKGDPVMVQPTLSDEEAKTLFSTEISTVNLPSGKNYIRVVDQSTDS